jgi:hypothetical protein
MKLFVLVYSPFFFKPLLLHPTIVFTRSRALMRSRFSHWSVWPTSVGPDGSKTCYRQWYSFILTFLMRLLKKWEMKRSFVEEEYHTIFLLPPPDVVSFHPYVSASESFLLCCCCSGTEKFATCLCLDKNTSCCCDVLKKRSWSILQPYKISIKTEKNMHFYFWSPRTGCSFYSRWVLYFFFLIDDLTSSLEVCNTECRHIYRHPIRRIYHSSDRYEQ